jgi:hypothetical protein
MNLEERYNAAGEDTYVGRVRKLQAAEVGPGPGVDFVDGVPRTRAAAPDQVQTEFTRNALGDFRYGGGGKVPGSPDDTYVLSRWLTRGIEKAFGAGGYFTNNRFTTINDVRNASTVVHKYAPIAGKRFNESAILSQRSKGRISGPPAGPSPAGLGG